MSSSIPVPARTSAIDLHPSRPNDCHTFAQPHAMASLPAPHHVWPTVPGEPAITTYPMYPGFSGCHSSPKSGLVAAVDKLDRMSNPARGTGSRVSVATEPANADSSTPTSWPPRPSLELVSRSARRWMRSAYEGNSTGAPSRPAPLPRTPPPFSLDGKGDGVVCVNGSESRAALPCADCAEGSMSRRARGGSAQFERDFSAVASAINNVRDALESGQGGVGRPPRDSVSGTYFFKGAGDHPAAAVFKPADEEPGEGEMSMNLVRDGVLGEYEGGSSGIGEDGFQVDGGTAGMGLGEGVPAMSPGSISSSSDGGARTLASRAGGGVEWHETSRASLLAAAGFQAGEGAYKEVAAYMLDHKSFANVPQTALAMCTVDDGVTMHGRTKMGAFQVYVENVGDAEDFGPGLFDVDMVHRIAVLDIRTLNHDRHAGNLLVTKDGSGSYGLVPIDHAFTLPEHVTPVPWAVWMDWPAAKKQMSAETLRYIAALKPDHEARILVDELGGPIRTGCIRSLKIATRLLQKGAVAGLSLYDIGRLIFMREGEVPDGYKSELQKIVEEAVKSAVLRQSHLGPDTVDVDDQVGQYGVFALDGASCNGRAPVHRQTEAYMESYIVRYACKLIDELVARIVANKSRGLEKCTLGRARSIPDFGFDVGAPVHASSKPYAGEVGNGTSTGPVLTTGLPRPTSQVLKRTGEFQPPKRSSQTAGTTIASLSLDRIEDPVLSSPLCNVVRPSAAPSVVMSLPVAAALAGKAPQIPIPIAEPSALLPPKPKVPPVVRKASPVAPHEFDWEHDA